MKTCLLWLSCIFSVTCFGAETLLVSRAPGHQFSPVTQAGEDVIRQIYANIGYQAEVKTLSFERESVLLQQGKLDAVLARFQTIGDKNPQLIRVEPAIAKLDLIMACHALTQCDLEQNKAIGFFKGLKVFARYCQQQKLNCREFDSDVVATRAFNNKVLDVLVSFEDIHRLQQLTKNQQQVYIKTIKGLAGPIFHYVHQRHKGLVPPLSAQLQAMHQKGELEQKLQLIKQAMYKHSQFFIIEQEQRLN